MRILMIAPQPFFQPRGTPFSELYRIRAMTELGHQVDLVTYPIGEDVDMTGLSIFRTPAIPGIKSVRIGPSLAKIPLDALVFTSSLRRLVSTRYDVLDCHEEAGLMGVVLSKLFGIPTIYDMHSSLPEQLENFGYSRSKVLRYLFDVAERITIKGSEAIIHVCPYLGEVVAKVDAGKPSFLIENSPLAESGTDVARADAKRLRVELGLDDAFVLLYTGTFEAYQGLELLYEALSRVHDPSVRLLMVGGKPEQVEAAQRDVAGLGMEDRVVFVGQRPPKEMSLYLAAADALVSPRSHGKNTPLKIYSYLRAGKPIVATRILTHTQVLDDEIAVLTEPEPEAFARGIDTIVSDRERARTLGDNARRRSDQEYSYERYLDRTRRLLEFVSEKLGRPLPRETPAATE